MNFDKDVIIFSPQDACDLVDFIEKKLPSFFPKRELLELRKDIYSIGSLISEETERGSTYQFDYSLLRDNQEMLSTKTKELFKSCGIEL